MMKSIHAVRRALTGGPINYGLLEAFSIENIDSKVDVGSFVKNEREANKHDFPQFEQTSSDTVASTIDQEKRAGPAAYRPSGQSGLDDF